jgi:hypothetical protein
MPTAICTTCGETIRWRNQRGVKIADFKCQCGGAYRAATWTPEGYKPRTLEAPHKGRKKAECLWCGCQTPLREKETRTVELWMSNINLNNRAWAMAIWTIQINEGDPLCSRCRPWEQISTYRLEVETRDWLYKQINGVGVNYYFPTE